jgi:hypothetical protein
MQQAFGAVRCGDCMKIFNAAYHLISHDPAAADPAEQGHPADENPHGIPTLHEHALTHTDDPATPPVIPEMAPATSTRDASAAPAPDYLYDPDPEWFEATDRESTEIETTEAASAPLHKDAMDALVTEARDNPPQPATQSPRRMILAALLALPLLGVVSYWLLNHQSRPAAGYLISDIRIAPASSPQQLEVHFVLGNAGNSSLPLPNLQIELLNLSLQPVATESVSASQVSQELTELAPGSNHALRVRVNRPATFVQTARIQPTAP